MKLARRFGPRLAGVSPEQFNRSKRRLGWALLSLLASVVFLVTGLLLTMIDLAVQYEQHGSIAFTGILVASLGLLLVGGVTAVVAKMTMPSLWDFVSFGPRTRPVAKTTNDLPVKTAPRPPRRPEYAH